ncbi:hypothetical protein GYH30_001132 [Glycine max]|uniref:Uncharacterized protein n=2 Tax=Glycine subgen. Soja TaxID=1462606 RepID=K7K319_SOYBN|nr:hypothetical protein GYH30_001132 [Glycine max]
MEKANIPFIIAAPPTPKPHASNPPHRRLTSLQNISNPCLLCCHKNQKGPKYKLKRSNAKSNSDLCYEQLKKIRPESKHIEI